MKAIFPSKTLEVVAQVYECADSKPVESKLRNLVVELTRRSGDVFDFKDLRENLAQNLGNSISSSADVKVIARRWGNV